jgi:hypothetical protein
MTKNVTTPRVTELTKIKITVINYHKGDNMEYLRSTIARDACYTSKNALRWKTEALSKVKQEITTLLDQVGSEIVDVQLARKTDLFHSMEDELEELQIRHDSDLQVHKTVTGEVWTEKPKSFREKNSQAVLEAARAILAS